MKSSISSSKLSISSENYAEKAWHLAGVLLSIGRPTTPAELAAKCSLFPASPEFVEFLCSIPNSPIILTRNGFVWPSMVACVAAVAFLAISMPKVQIGFGGARSLCGDVMKTYYRKRKRFGSDIMPIVKKRAVFNLVDDNEREKFSSCLAERVVKSCFQVGNLHTDHIGRAIDILQLHSSTKVVNLDDFSKTMAIPRQQQNLCSTGGTMDVTHSIFSSNMKLGYQLNNDEELKNGNEPYVHKDLGLEEQTDHVKYNVAIPDMLDLDWEKNIAPLLESLEEIPTMLEENNVDKTELMNKIDFFSTCLEPEQQNGNALVETPTVINTLEASGNDMVFERTKDELSQWPRVDANAHEGVKDFPFGCEKSNTLPQENLSPVNTELPNVRIPDVKYEVLGTNGENGAVISADQLSVTQKSLPDLSAIMKNVPQDKLIQKQQITSKPSQQDKVDIANKKLKNKKDPNANFLKQKYKNVVRNNAVAQEKCAGVHKSTKDNQESKSIPEFDSYIVEEEEGSGGYGTVYKARRKSDGVTFAIKCPHVNAHKHHLRNELRMLERFGGRNFVIKYEGSVKNGSSDCFVLEHVEHDRPEVLKREISIFQLQWYGYCMFKALASLHKQGVFHRDVKPGNFLFSCKSNKGYLIDFNLAKDMHQKNENADKLLTSYSTSLQHLSAVHSKSASPSKKRKILGGKSGEFIRTVASGGSNLENNNLKKKALDKLKAYDDLGRRNSMTSQGAEASGLTSAKDITPAEKLREPLPCQGRKELINLAQEAMQNPSPGALSAPASKRKRVAASPGIIEKKLIHISPMPLHSSSIAIQGAGSLKNRDVKTNKEGPCAGTKGFRAPEVLLRSLYQGPKIDVWSAGVTLIYLITGKMPFSGEPEQNMKDIVKIKGNEELWEVAKLHNREPSFPVDLLDVRYLPSVGIKRWCVENTKRPHFLQQIPESLFDLMEKCLAVNPRLRISAEEALRHEFFASCHEALEKQRSLRRGPNQDTRNKSLSFMDEVSTSKTSIPSYVQHSATPVK